MQRVRSQLVTELDVDHVLVRRRDDTYIAYAWHEGRGVLPEVAQPYLGRHAPNQLTVGLAFDVDAESAAGAGVLQIVPEPSHEQQRVLLMRGAVLRGPTSHGELQVLKPVAAEFTNSLQFICFGLAGRFNLFRGSHKLRMWVGVRTEGAAGTTS